MGKIANTVSGRPQKGVLKRFWRDESVDGRFAIPSMAALGLACVARRMAVDE